MRAGPITRFISGLLPFLLVCATVCAEPFIVEDIRVEGLERINPGTVFNYLPIKVGDTFEDSRSADVVRALFRTGYFKDIQLARDGNIIVVAVQERESIAEINFTGNKAIKSEDLLKGLAEVGFAVGEVFDEGILDKVVQELRRQYYGQGKYGVKVTTELQPLPGNRVAVGINVAEGKAARIKEINIVGNEEYKDKKLLKLFELSNPNILSFFHQERSVLPPEALRRYGDAA